MKSTIFDIANCVTDTIQTDFVTNLSDTTILSISTIVCYSLLANGEEKSLRSLLEVDVVLETPLRSICKVVRPIEKALECV